jgi:hypothetical protein
VATNSFFNRQNLKARFRAQQVTMAQDVEANIILLQKYGLNDNTILLQLLLSEMLRAPSIRYVFSVLQLSISAGIMELLTYSFDKYNGRPEWESSLLSNYYYVLFKKKKKKKKKRNIFELNVPEEIPSNTHETREPADGYFFVFNPLILPEKVGITRKTFWILTGTVSSHFSISINTR